MVKLQTMAAATTLTLPRWYDLHTHLRQDALMAPVIRSQLAMGCAGVLAMPNTNPPVGKVFKKDDLPYWSIEEYSAMIRAAGGDEFDDVIIPLYLTGDTTPQIIARGTESGLLRACKYYPPHGTTGAGFARPFSEFFDNGVFEAMQDNDIILCVHGEEHDMRSEDYFSRHDSAEEFFYRERLPRLLDQYPRLKIVAEHVTTKTAVDLVLQADNNVAASVTPQHLLYTAGHLLRGFNYHLYCLPLVKFEDDRAALRRVVTDPGNSKFFAGTDNAPHTVKATACGCAAGCFTGGIAPQLYAEAFEQSGVNLAEAKGQKIFENFLCRIGPAFYGLPVPQERFSLVREPQKTAPLPTPDGPLMPLPLGMGRDSLPWRIKA